MAASSCLVGGKGSGVPLSAAPPPEGITLAVIVEGIIGHALLIGLPLAAIARRNANGGR